MSPDLARWCADVLDKGAVEAISARAATYATDKAWDALVDAYRRPGGCDDLAEAARELLKLRRQLHEALGGGVAAAVESVGGTALMAVFARELASRLTMPFDAQVAAAARGLQIAGICVCLLTGADLAECACLRDVARAEGEKQVEVLARSALEDWRYLPL
ncbi:hypothetical protein AB0I02_33440 [Streptomyces phaeochromogenes]